MTKEKKVRMDLEAPASIKEKARVESKKLFGKESISAQTLDQIIYDANCYKTNLIAIEKAKEKLPNYIGKPFYEGILESIHNWEKSNIEIKKTFIPFMEKAILELKTK